MGDRINILLEYLSINSLIKLINEFSRIAKNDINIDKQVLMHKVGDLYSSMTSIQRYDMITAISRELGYEIENVSIENWKTISL